MKEESLAESFADMFLELLAILVSTFTLRVLCFMPEMFTMKYSLGKRTTLSVLQKAR